MKQMTIQMNQDRAFRIQELVLTAAECEDALDIAADARAQFGADGSPDPVTELANHAQQLPPRLKQFLEHVRQDDRTVAAVLRGGWHPELDQLRTPTDWRHGRATKAGNLQNFVLVLYGSLLGDVFSWHGQQDGSLVHDLVPTYADRNEQLGSGSQAPLCWHTEDAFHPYRSDFVILYSMRAKEDARSTLSWLAQGVLDPGTIATLMEDKFEFEPDTSYTDHGTFINAPVALLYGSASAPYLRADSVYYKLPPGQRERTALTELYAVLDAALVEIEMATGDMLVLNNRRVVHGRSKFNAQYDGTDRWVKRVNVTSDLTGSRASRCCQASRIVHLAPERNQDSGTHTCDRFRVQSLTGVEG
jgi:L-asparagine oxygenase